MHSPPEDESIMKITRRYLYVTIEGGGNVPVLGVVRRLVEIGHTVRVQTGPVGPF